MFSTSNKIHLEVGRAKDLPYFTYIWLSSVPRTLLLKNIWITVTITALFLRNFLSLAKHRVRGGALTVRLNTEDFVMVSVVARFRER